MEHIIIPGGILVLVLGSVIYSKYDAGQRPTFTQARKLYKERGVCDEVHKRVDEKLTAIEKKIDFLISKKG